jgi:hypothetical protein
MRLYNKNGIHILTLKKRRDGSDFIKPDKPNCDDGKFIQISVDKDLCIYLEEQDDKVEEQIVVFKKIPNYGDLFEIEDFLEQVKNNCFKPYDGEGNYATKNKISNIPFDFNHDLDHPDWATHIVWFNK